jgi:hypothetical protein
MSLCFALLTAALLGHSGPVETSVWSELSPETSLAIGTIQSGQNEKASRTAAQQKIDSQLLYALKQKRGETEGVPQEPIQLDLDSKERALVDITADVTPQVTSQIRKLGGAIVSSDERYHTVRARLALEKLEKLAALKDVRSIAPAAMPGFNRIRLN